MILQNFDLSKDDPTYKLKIKHLLTIKPEGFKIRAKLRQDRNATAFHKSLRVVADEKSSATSGAKKSPQPSGGEGTQQDNRLIHIFYGSETGTCEALAQHLASEMSMRGFVAKVDVMNAATTRPLPQGEPVVFILGSYHGTPATNASKFMEWLEQQGQGNLKGVQFAVYGVGKVSPQAVPPEIAVLFPP